MHKWTTSHAAAMIAAAVLGTLLGTSVLALAGALSMGVFIGLGRRTWTPSGAFGAANAVTALRLAGTLLLLIVPLSDVQVALGLLSILLLDVADGWLARTFDCASAFGAEFDVESDALLVLCASALLHARGVAGPWVLLAGLWRYVYVLTLASVEPRGRLKARSLLARTLYVVMLGSFVLASVVPARLGSWLALVGTATVSLSFCLSFWKLYFAVPRAPGAARDRIL